VQWLGLSPTTNYKTRKLLLNAGFNKEQASDLSLSLETDVTVNLTTFEELLMTKTKAQKINKSGWMDPSDDWGQDGG